MPSLVLKGVASLGSKLGDLWTTHEKPSQTLYQLCYSYDCEARPICANNLKTCLFTGSIIKDTPLLIHLSSFKIEFSTGIIRDHAFLKMRGVKAFIRT